MAYNTTLDVVTDDQCASCGRWCELIEMRLDGYPYDVCRPCAKQINLRRARQL